MAKKTPKPKTVRVQIIASQVVHYTQMVELDAADWERFENACESNDSRQCREIAKRIAEIYINVSDVDDADEFDGNDVEITKE